ncbi:hypothetical protein L2E82_45010 [Cichorium intybus]|uniref:Uncharacterized protein n=1 Tax=Cichorium intybus TaxID=13427 RepID=A0ACB8ZRP7_CICIN|nr:hypothetical protein L2E82_45010 [Cichorium intybus]
MWKTKDFKDRQNYEIEEGEFPFDEGTELPFDESEKKEKTIEEYEEIFENVFKIVLDGKKNIEEIVSICMTKFPNENRTKDLVKRMKDLFWGNFSPKDNNSEFCGDEHLNEQENYHEGDNVMNEADNGGKEDSGLVEFEPIQPLQQVAAEVSDTDIDVEEYIALENIIGEKDGESSYVTPKNIVKDKESMEILFETSPEDILTRHHFESMRPDHSIHRFVIDCWTAVLNFEENKLKSKSSPSRLFFNTQILTENLLDDSTTFLKRFRIFDDNVNCFISELNREIDFNNLNLVFFAIHNGDQFYAIVFNLTSMEIIILDSMRLSGKIEDMYGKIPQLLYFGEKEGKWDIELGKENNKTRMRIAKLRGFYAAKFATHTINRKRKRNMEEANEFANIDRKTRAKMAKDGIDARNQLEMGNK